jgi:lactate dehydrogenase-like 2-hydroxyacid dehydrogenase
MSNKPKILFFSSVKHALAQYAELQESTAPEVVTSESREEFFKDCQTKYKDVAAIYRTSASGAVSSFSPSPSIRGLNLHVLTSPQVAGKFDAELIQQLPESVKFICHNGAGYDQIDVDACSARGITVTYAPDPVTDATADLAVFLLLGALRQLNPALMSLRKGDFKQNLAFGHDPQGKTLGILGMGRIGRALARRMQPFGMKVVYHSRRPVEGAGNAEPVSFEQLLKQSDVLSVHVPLSKATQHLIGPAEIQRMKPGVVIVNTARGAVIDEAAMAEALETGHIAAVGLDVYEEEPKVHPKLVANPRALLVPHLGTHTTETLAKMEGLAMENARRGVLGEKLLTVVPEQCS